MSLNSSVTRRPAAIIQSPIDELNPRSRNPRSHSKHQIHQIAKSIEAFGFTSPLLVDAENGVIAGHGRLAAAKLLGLSSVPTIRLDFLTKDQIRAYVIADNRLAEMAGWDEQILAIELQGLLDIDLGFDIEVTGFNATEIDLLIEASTPVTKEDEQVIPDDCPAVSRTGDRWILGSHRLLCGDCLDRDELASLMNGDMATAVFTDPPFNVPISGHVSGLGKIRHREFAMASGEMSAAAFQSFLSAICSNLAANSLDGSLHYVCMDWRHIGDLLEAGSTAYDELKNICIWTKDNGGMGSLYRSQHEMVAVFKKGTARHMNNVQLGKYGRNRTNVWSYPGINTFSRHTDEGNLGEVHPTVKPVALIADALLDCTARKSIVLDAFIGSGSTLIAAERTGRRCYGMEIDPLYIDATIRRWQRYTGDSAIHSESGLTFFDVERDRSATHA